MHFKNDQKDDKNKSISDILIDEQQNYSEPHSNDRITLNNFSESFFEIEDFNNANFGFINLIILLLILAVACELILSVQRYGFLYNPLILFKLYSPNLIQILLHVIYLPLAIVFIELIFTFENLLFRKNKSKEIIKYLEFITIALLSLAPLIYSRLIPMENKNLLFDPTCWYVLLALKLVSFIHTNSLYRLKIRDANSIEYYTETANVNEHLNRTKLYYFIISPVVCYELSFARNESIRKSYILKKLIKILIASNILIFILQQLYAPIIVLVFKSIDTKNYQNLTVYILHICLYTNISWLLSFYIFFPCWLNILSEFLKFKDRDFYRDWWNSISIEYFWRTWNIPIHKWCKRHILNPLLEFGYHPILGRTIVFLISGILHEYIVGAFVNIIHPWSFLVMMFQIPSCFIVTFPKNCRLKNLSFWILLITSQGLGTLSYAYSYKQSSGKCKFKFDYR
ncbi:hypothetical protein HZS_3081 [Henneguya salminicola]|nr:hypothetical protein HZS_3081 [Henneguya salminicola]